MKKLSAKNWINVLDVSVIAVRCAHKWRLRIKMHIPYHEIKHKELLKRIPNLHETVVVVVIKNG